MAEANRSRPIEKFNRELSVQRNSENDRKYPDTGNEGEPSFKTTVF